MQHSIEKGQLRFFEHNSSVLVDATCHKAAVFHLLWTHVAPNFRFTVTYSPLVLSILEVATLFTTLMRNACKEFIAICLFSH